MTTPKAGGSSLMEDYLGVVKERDQILEVLLAIVNTAQDNPDRCMADVCNDNFTAHNLPLTAVMTGSEYNRIKIINTPTDAASGHGVARPYCSASQLRYGNFLHADGGQSFAEYLGIDAPVTEYGHWGHNLDKVRMKSKRATGKWCMTKKEAKASYKAALARCRKEE